MRNSLSKIYRSFFLTDLFGISYTCVVYSPVFRAVEWETCALFHRVQRTINSLNIDTCHLSSPA